MTATQARDSLAHERIEATNDGRKLKGKAKKTKIVFASGLAQNRMGNKNRGKGKGKEEKQELELGMELEPEL